MKKALFILLALFSSVVSAAINQILIAQDGSQFPIASIVGSPTYQADVLAATTALESYQTANQFDTFTLRTIESTSGNYFDFLSTPTGVSFSCFSSAGQLLGTDPTSCYGVIPGITPSSILQAAAQDKENVTALNAATTINLQLNRSTTQISQSLQSMRSLRNQPKSAKGHGAGDDAYELMGNFGLYANAGGTFGKVDRTSNSNGYDVFTRNFNSGVDYKINDMTVTGMLFGYTSTAVDVADNGGNFNADTFRFSPFISLSPTENTYIDIAAGYASHDNTSKRNCLLCTSTADASFRTDEFNILTGLGYTHNFDAWSLRGYGQASTIYMDIGGYSETGSSATGLLTLPNQYVLSITSTFGAELSYAWSFPFGVLIPRVSAEWVREYANDQRSIIAQLQNGGTSVIQTTTAQQDWGNAAAGLQMVLPNGVSAMLNFQSLIMSGAVNHSIEGGLRVEF